MNKRQLALRQHLMNLRIPEEWAHLIAERATEVGCINGLKETKASDLLLGAFSWFRAPEGDCFWSDVHDAFESEEEWFEENGDLTPEQVADIDKMVDAGMPQEWAILIAQRRYDPVCCWRGPRKDNLHKHFNQAQSPKKHLQMAFEWDKAPEGRQFWASLHQALGGWN